MQIYKAGFMLRPPTNCATRTYVFIGLERGGTSPVAGVARALGLNLGKSLDNNNEDPDFVHRPMSHIMKIVEERNTKLNVWGWKFPKASHELPMYLHQLRNPHIVVISRDPVAVALGHKKWNGPEMDKPIQLSLTEAAAYDIQNIGFALASSVPALMVSYELFKDNLSDAIDMMADFLQVSRPGDALRQKIVAYLTGTGYKNFDEYFGSPAHPPSNERA